MGVDVQRGGRGDMADDGGKGLGVHSVFQSSGCEGMPEVMESNFFASRPLQHSLESLSDRSWVQRGILHDRGWEHPAGGYGLTVFLQNFQDRLYPYCGVTRKTKPRGRP